LNCLGGYCLVNQKIGQIRDYLKECPRANFMLLIFGDTMDKQDKNIIELNKFTQELKCRFYYFGVE